jgi:imidazolonepropionase-like amidohydrolase
MRVQRAYSSEVVYLQKEDGEAYLKDTGFETMVSFPVNKRSTAFLCAIEKDEGNNFIVTALSTDGGAIPRNFLLSHGLSLVRFNALRLAEFVLKAAWAPAQMLGLFNKGHLAPGSDADLVVADSSSHVALLTVAGGQIIMSNGVVSGRGGTLLTTDRGAISLNAKGVNHRAVDLSKSLFYTK